MKKLLTLLLAATLFAGTSFAQEKNPVVHSEKNVRDDHAKHLKKDGTPDKRFKENKKPPEAEKPKHLKKDGTPDKRFKENKQAPPKKG